MEEDKGGATEVLGGAPLWLSILLTEGKNFVGGTDDDSDEEEDKCSRRFACKASESECLKSLRSLFKLMGKLSHLLISFGSI